MCVHVCVRVYPHLCIQMDTYSNRPAAGRRRRGCWTRPPPRGCWRGWVGRWRARGRGQARHGRGAARRGDAPMGQGPATAGRRGRAVAARCATRGACSHGAQRRTGGETRISQRLASHPASFRAVRPIWPDASGRHLGEYSLSGDQLVPFLPQPNTGIAPRDHPIPSHSS